MTNLLGVIVLLSMFVLIHIVAAIQSFKMITLIPHHLPRLIGFSSAGRVDVDQYAKDAALIGIGGTMAGISGTVEQLSQGIRRPGAPATQKQIGTAAAAAATGSSGSNATAGMDSTLRAATDNSGPNGSEEA